MDRLILKPGKEKSLLKRHPWIFSGAIEKFHPITLGQVLPVYSSSGQFLAKAYFHPENSIAGRVLTFHNEPIEEALSRHIDQAIQLRQTLFSDQTNCCQLINAEGDSLPGLIVDLYDRVLVIQINTAGMEALKEQIVKLLIEKMHPIAIFEKSLSSARKMEGLSDHKVFSLEPLPI